MIIRPGSDTIECFGEEVPADLVRAWATKGKKQVIGQAELAPVLVAKTLWAPDLLDVALLAFVDNEAAKLSLVSGVSPTPASEAILCASALCDAHLGTHQWVSRVPSASNPADAPSRLEFPGGWRRRRVRRVDWAALRNAVPVDSA